MIKLSLYAQGLKSLHVLNDPRLKKSAGLFTLVLIISGCAASGQATSPSKYPAFKIVYVYEKNQDPMRLALQRENLILSAELRYQKSIIATLQQTFATIDSSVIEPTAHRQLMPATVVDTDNLSTVFRRLWPVAIYTAWRTARVMMRR